MTKKYPNEKIVNGYVDSILDGTKIACKELKMACNRFKKDIKKQAFDYNPYEAEWVIGIIERVFVHEQGEAIDGTPLPDTPFILEPWQKFIIYNLLSFYKKGTKNRRYKEAFIMVPRKNGKTPFISALGFALGLLEKNSGSKVYICASNLRDAMQSFNFLKYNINHMGEASEYRILDNNQSHSFERKFTKGSLKIEALIARDSIVGNVNILDELHEYKTSKMYDRMKKAQKAYTNKLTIGITTAGDDMNSFCYRRMQYCIKVLKGQIKDEQYFVFITKADEEQGGYVDYTNPAIHEMANPNFNVTIRPEDILESSLQAQNDPQSRKEFYAKDINVYTSSIKSYFDLREFQTSDEKYNWGWNEPVIVDGNELVNLKELAKLNIRWFGGIDLSKLYDLTGVALYGEYKGVDIIIPHAFFPVVKAKEKADKDKIPYFGWEDDGWLTMINNPVIEYDDVIKWFVQMRELGFHIVEVGFDRRFAKELVKAMEKLNFKMEDVPQKYWIKSNGFRHIEAQAKKGKLYYLHAEPYEYCVENVRALETPEEQVRYEKTSEEERMDLFDASVIAAVRYKESLAETNPIDDWEW